MSDLPNGFTGFSKVPSDFESAADAMRKARGESRRQERTQERTQVGAPRHAKHAAENGAQSGVPFPYSNDSFADRQVEGAVPLDPSKVDSLPANERNWAWVEINLSAIRHNVAETRRFLKPRTRLMAVVKADAYGHGALEVSKVMLGAGADRLAVSNVDEAVELRKGGVTAPILILSQPPAAAIPLLLAYQATPTIYTPDFAIAYAEAADLHGMKAPYHLAINTGMNRIGVRFDDALEFVRQVDFHRALELEGVYTHYATADDAEPLEYQRQTRRFVQALEDLHNADFDFGLVHVANSAAAFRYPDIQFDMVRCGIALYGIHPCADTHGRVDLHPAMSVHARVTDARLVPMSEGVSFGLNYRSPGSVKICTIPVGYANGLSRRLSNKIDFIMAGRYFRQVGDICMDQCMFEVDMRVYGTRERIDLQIGDEVIVVGSQGVAQVTVDELAEKLDTTPYEVVVGLSRGMERIYV